MTCNKPNVLDHFRLSWFYLYFVCNYLWDYWFHDVSFMYLILNTLGLCNIHIQTSCLPVTACRCAFRPCFLVLFILRLIILRHSLWSLTVRSFLLALLVFGLLTFSFTACRWCCSSTSAPLLCSTGGNSAFTRTAVQLLNKRRNYSFVML